MKPLRQAGSLTVRATQAPTASVRPRERKRAMPSSGVATFTSVVTAVGGLIVAVFGYIGYQNRRARLTSIRQTFNEVIGSLAADDEERRLAGAILLRRFFDETSELGLRTLLPLSRRAPYAQEAVGVIAAVLRGLKGGDFQKLLADGVAYAPNLMHADFQKTNMQNAYLAPRRIGASLEGADFYRADLSGASLKGANAPRAVFYQARLRGTVLKNADLRKANFFQADLSGAKFEGSRLKGADFREARGIPEEITPQLDENYTYNDDEPVPERQDPPTSSAGAGPRSIFLSAPSGLAAAQQEYLERFARRIEELGFTTEQLRRTEYPRSGQLGEIRRRMSGCDGVVVLGFTRSQPGESSPHSPNRADGPTPWNNVEAGMAFALDLPILVVAPIRLQDGIFDAEISEASLFRLPLDDEFMLDLDENILRGWAGAVGERPS
jgi:uncharacterized protein YjbI with pentapeptide repeats